MIVLLNSLEALSQDQNLVGDDYSSMDYSMVISGYRRLNCSFSHSFPIFRTKSSHRRRRFRSQCCQRLVKRRHPNTPKSWPPSSHIQQMVSDHLRSQRRKCQKASHQPLRRKLKPMLTSLSKRTLNFTPRLINSTALERRWKSHRRFNWVQRRPTSHPTQLQWYHQLIVTPSSDDT